MHQTLVKESLNAFKATIEDMKAAQAVLEKELAANKPALHEFAWDKFDPQALTSVVSRAQARAVSTQVTLAHMATQGSVALVRRQLDLAEKLIPQPLDKNAVAPVRSALDFAARQLEAATVSYARFFGNKAFAF